MAKLTPEDLKIIRWSRNYALRGKTLNEIKELYFPWLEGEISDEDLPKKKSVPKFCDRDINPETGYRIFVDKVLADEELMMIADMKTADIKYLKELYCSTTIKQKELMAIFDMSEHRFKKLHKEGSWKKRPNLLQIESFGRLKELIMRDSFDIIIPPKKQTQDDIEKAYKDVFFKIRSQIIGELSMAVIDGNRVGELRKASEALRKNYENEMVANRYLFPRDFYQNKAIERKLDLEEKKLTEDFGDTNIIQFNQINEIQPLLYLFKKVLGSFIEDKTLQSKLFDKLIDEMAAINMVEKIGGKD